MVVVPSLDCRGSFAHRYTHFVGPALVSYIHKTLRFGIAGCHVTASTLTADNAELSIKGPLP
jgi:hypothetical protein